MAERRIILEELIYGYSVEDMASQFIKEEWDWDDEAIKFGIKVGFEAGFKAHKEFNEDKLFTIEDMKDAFNAGNEGSGGNVFNRVRKYTGFDNYVTKALGFLWDNESGYIIPSKTEWDIKIDEHGKIKLI